MVSKTDLDREVAAAKLKLRQMSMHFCILCSDNGTITKYYCKDNDTRVKAMARLRRHCSSYDALTEAKPLLTVDVGGRIMKH